MTTNPYESPYEDAWEHSANGRLLHIILRIVAAPFLGAICGAIIGGFISTISLLMFEAPSVRFGVDLVFGVIYMSLFAALYGLPWAFYTGASMIPCLFVARQFKLIDAVILAAISGIIGCFIADYLERTPTWAPATGFLTIRATACACSAFAVIWFLGRARNLAHDIRA